MAPPLSERDLLLPALDLGGIAARAAGVPWRLYRRHLGLPAGVPDDEATLRLAAEAREWFRDHGTPWLGVAGLRLEELCGSRVLLEGGTVWTSKVLARGFRDAGARAVAVIGASAGARAGAEVDERWRAGRPDEALFLGALAAAAVEHLRAEAAAALREILARESWTLLPHYSPGYPGWDLSDQGAVLGALVDAGPIQVLPSGMLLPLRSTLAVCGLTQRQGAAPAEIGWTARAFWSTRASRAEEITAAEADPAAPPAYSFPVRALEKWSRHRLSLVPGASGGLTARFRFDGTTCSSLGLPIALHYELDLAAEGDEGYRIVRLSCEPAPGDRGHRSMCAFLADAAGFAITMREIPPLIGLRLDQALQWMPAMQTSGCVCEAAHRHHKWRLVLETVHHRLAAGRRED